MTPAPRESIPSESAPTNRLASGGFSLRSLLTSVTFLVLLISAVVSSIRLHQAETELEQMRRELGYLAPSGEQEVAAIRLHDDLPLTYRVRIRVPAAQPYRVAYSTFLPKRSSVPTWYAAAPAPPGESLVTIRIAEDPRDERWKISIWVESAEGTRRIHTVLPEAHVEVFRGNHQVIRSGVGKQMVTVAAGQRMSLVHDTWLVGEEGLLLYGDRPIPKDQIGVFAELQPDQGPL